MRSNIPVQSVLQYIGLRVTFLLCARCLSRATFSDTFRQLYDLRELTECFTVSYIIAFRSLAESRAAAKEYADSLKRYFVSMWLTRTVEQYAGGVANCTACRVLEHL